jgi:hypothetical protein
MLDKYWSVCYTIIVKRKDKQKREGEKTMKVYRVIYRVSTMDGIGGYTMDGGLYLYKETAERVAEHLENGRVKEEEVNEEKN